MTVARVDPLNGAIYEWRSKLESSTATPTRKTIREPSVLIATSLGGNEATGRLALAYGPTEDLVDRRMLKYACEALYKSIKQVGLDLIFRLASHDFTLMVSSQRTKEPLSQRLRSTRCDSIIDQSP